MNAGDQGVTRHAEARLRLARPRRNKRTDGSDGPATPAPPVEARVQVVSQPGAQNSALKEQPKPGDGVDPNHPARETGLSIGDRALGQVLGGARKRIAVCGFASSSRDLAPVHDPAWEIWGLNQLYRHIKRADRWFDVHYYWEQEVVPGTEGTGAGSYVQWLATCGMPVYMHHLVAEIPTSVRFPVERLIERHGSDYFTSTIAFMVALAVDEIEGRVEAEFRDWIRAHGKREVEATDLGALKKAMYGEYAVGVFGVDLIVGDEYFWQKSCAEFWLGQASARGINVVLPPMTALCKQLYRYGYEKEPESIIKLSELNDHRAQLAKDREEHMKALYCIDGAIQADSYWTELVTLRLRGLGSAVVPPKA